MPEPLPPSSPSAACEEGAKGLNLSEEGSVCVSACVSVLISVTLLPALVLCQQEVRASSTLPSDRHTDTHTQRVPPSLPTQEPLPSWPCSQGNTHQLHLGTQPFQDPVGSLRLLLQVGKGRGRKKKKVICAIRLQAAALCFSSPFCLNHFSNLHRAITNPIPASEGLQRLSSASGPAAKSPG